MAVQVEIAYKSFTECEILHFRVWREWEHFAERNRLTHGTGYVDKVVRIWDAKRVVYSTVHGRHYTKTLPGDQILDDQLAESVAHKRGAKKSPYKPEAFEELPISELDLDSE